MVCVGRVVLFDGAGQAECHEEAQEGPFRSSLGDPTAWLQEGTEARSGPDCVRAGVDEMGGEVLVSFGLFWVQNLV